MQEGDELLVSYLARNAGRWLQKNRRWKAVLLVSAVVLPLALAYHVLIVRPNRNADRMNDDLWLHKAWEARQQPIPKEDESLAEQLIVWDEIRRRQRDPDYAIPEDKFELIKKHWETTTSELTEEQIEFLREMLDL